MSYLSFAGGGRRLLLGLLLSALIVLGIATDIGKAETQPAGQGIQISPVIIDLNAEKGKTYNLKVTVTNVTAGDLVLKASIADFRAKDETGTPDILADNDSGDNRTYSFKKWVSPLGELYLRSKESQSVNVPVNVPADAEAGGHYGVIRFSGTPPELADQNVALIASVGVLVLTRVEGPITENLSLKEIFVEHNGKRRGILENGPLTIVSRIENTGNVHVKPSGDVTVKNIFGATVATLPFTNQPKNVLPKSIRRFEQHLNKKWLFGRYTVSITAGYGTTGKTLTGTASFWVIPYKVIAISLGFLLIAFWILKRLIRRYNKKIIKKAQRRD